MKQFFLMVVSIALLMPVAIKAQIYSNDYILINEDESTLFGMQSSSEPFGDVLSYLDIRQNVNGSSTTQTVYPLDKGSQSSFDAELGRIKILYSELLNYIPFKLIFCTLFGFLLFSGVRILRMLFRK